MTCTLPWPGEEVEVEGGKGESIIEHHLSGGKE